MAGSVAPALSLSVLICPYRTIRYPYKGNTSPLSKDKANVLPGSKTNDILRFLSHFNKYTISFFKYVIVTDYPITFPYLY